MYLLTFDEHQEVPLREDLDLGEDSDSETDDGRSDDNITIFLEFDWERILGDERFMREEASWRRMLVSQPPAREAWNHNREAGESLYGVHARRVNSKEERGKRIGITCEDVRRVRANPNCERVRTRIRSSERFGVVVLVNVDVKPIDSEEDMTRFYTKRLRI